MVGELPPPPRLLSSCCLFGAACSDNLKERRIALMGPPGSGKSTHASFIAKEYCLCKVATGDILRAAVAAHTPLGSASQTAMESGKLVLDDIMIPLVRKTILEVSSRPECRKGLVLDGFPRTRYHALKVCVRRDCPGSTPFECIFSKDIYCITTCEPDGVGGVGSLTSASDVLPNCLPGCLVTSFLLAECSWTRSWQRLASPWMWRCL